MPACAKHPPQHAGFTLLELLVALAVFAIMATAAYSGLQSVLFTRAAVEAQAERLARIQLAMHILERDFEQSIDRPVRDEFGLEQPAFAGGNLSDDLVVFTRVGWSNPLDQRRATLQRVAYRLDGENNLLRLYWTTLDRGGVSEPREMILLEAVAEVQLRYLDQNGEWRPEWPPPTVQQVQTPLPRAVEITLTLTDWGDIVRLLRPPEPFSATPLPPPPA